MDLVGLWAQLACVWEATARKPGNVHRYADFPDLHYLDFLAAAAAAAPVLAAAPGRPVGDTILASVRATQAVVRGNANLGILLLLAPLAAVPPHDPLRPGLDRILAALDVADARSAYEAIRLANPGGLGQVPDQDVHDEPTAGLRQVMALAADRDLVALQYVTGFRTVFDDALPALRTGLDTTGCLEGAVIGCHLALLARHPDSLIARKHGPAVAEVVRRQVHDLLASGWPAGPDARARRTALDQALRSAIPRLNPGTTADLVAATLFVALRQGVIRLPPPQPWTLDEGAMAW